MLVAKALGGGIMPVSAVLSSKEIMSVFTPGNHGSTFGGSPLACAIGTAALEVLVDEKLDKRAEKLGVYFRKRLKAMNNPLFKVRGKGLLVTVELTKDAGPARQYTEALIRNGPFPDRNRRSLSLP